MKDMLDTFVDKFFHDGIFCRKCNTTTKHYRIYTRKAYVCSKCGTHFYPLSGTIFNKSRTPLVTWLYAFERLSKDNKYPALKLSRATGITYKTAWRIKKLVLENIGGK